MAEAEKNMVFAARLTQQGHKIASMDDLMELYEKSFSVQTIAAMGALPHPTIQKFAVIMAPKSEAEKIVEVLRQCPYSKDAAIIGEVTEEQPGHVVMTTEIGTQALLPQPGGELLPRIC